MDQKHKTIINDNLDALVDTTEHLDAILRELIENEVINKYMYNNIMHKFEGRKARIRSLYQLIQCRGPNAFKNLISCLSRTQNAKAVDLLSSYRITQKAYVDNEPTENESESLTSQLATEEKEEYTTVGRIKIHPKKEFMDVAKDNPIGVYRMRSQPRGFALIVNVRETVGLLDREGSEVDFENLKILFSGLGYKINELSNPNREELMSAIKEFVKNPELSDVDSTVVFTMSHGNSRGGIWELTTADGKFVTTEWIIEQFNYSSLITKQNQRKPKMFFFQACRIDKPTCDKTDVDSVIFDSDENQRIHEDMFVVCPVVNGQTAKRHREKGSWFVQEFCKVVREYAWQHDLEELVAMVHNRVREMKHIYYGGQTTEISKQGISKKIYFNPGLYEERTL